MCALFALALLVYLPLRSEGLASDGARYLAFIEAGVLTNAHFLFLPLAALVRGAFGLGAHESATLTSALAAAIGLSLLAAALWRRVGRIGAAFATALLLFAPALRIQAGAVEVHAAAFLAASIAWLLVAPLAPRRVRPFAGACAGFALVLGHFSSCLWLPALACAAAAPRGGGDPLRARCARAAACLAGGAAGIAAIFVLGWWATPLPGESLSPLRTYLHHWTSGVAIPPRGAALDLWIVEVAAPLGPLLPLALLGVLVSLRNRERAAAALVLALMPGPFLALAIGAQENGAYLLPALPPMAIAAARAARALTSAPRSAALLALCACAAEHLLRVAWALSGPLPRGALVAGDAGLTPEYVAAWPPGLVPPVPLCVAVCVASIAAAALLRRRPGAGLRGQLGVAFLALIVVGQIGLARASDARSPSRDQRELHALGRAFREIAPDPSDLLVAIERSDNARAILRRALGREALFLPSLADGDPLQARAEREALRARLLASGRTASFPRDLFSPLVARTDAEAIDWVRAQEEAGLLVRLPARTELRSTGAMPRFDPRVIEYAERADREIEPGARLLTCVPDAALRGALAALLPRPFRDLSSEPLPPSASSPRWILCDRGLVLWLDLALALPDADATVRELKERIASGALGRWQSAEGATAARAEGFWVAARGGR